MKHRGPFAVFLLDLLSILKQLRCVLRRRHDLHSIGAITKKGGFQGIPVAQCGFCAAIVTTGTEKQEKRFGVRP